MMNTYCQDGITSIHNHDFIQNEDFSAAYERGVKAAGKDYMWQWRVHIGIWVAKSVVGVPGDFVECGVNAGFMSSAIMHSLNWNELNKNFYLLDTFNGMNKNHISKEELSDGILFKNAKLIADKFYVTSSSKVRENFSEWKNVKIIEGVIPLTLKKITSSRISFLHIDLNCVPPEIAAIEYLWPRMASGGMVLLDDYAYFGHHHQKTAMDLFAKKNQIAICSLPTGQGLILKA
jgi:Macrocin-O-methyltransferase (TylF)